MTDGPIDWASRWQQGRIGFHRDVVHEHLVAHVNELVGPAGQPGAVLVPLCGKTLDLWHLKNAGFGPVVGVEVVREAADQFFAEAHVEPVADGPTLSGDGVDVMVGDFFTLPAAGQRFDAIWDRAALIAMEPHRREAYRDRILELLAPEGTYLLVSLDYPQDAMPGPPFSVSDEVVKALFGSYGSLQRLAKVEVPPHPRAGDTLATESVFLFRRRP